MAASIYEIFKDKEVQRLLSSLTTPDKLQNSQNLASLVDRVFDLAANNSTIIEKVFKIIKDYIPDIKEHVYSSPEELKQAEFEQALASLKQQSSIPTLYRIGAPGSWSILTYGANKKNPIDICMRGAVGGGPSCVPVFFTSISEAEDFVEKLNNSGRLGNFEVPYSRIYQARLQKKDYVDNFAKVNTIAGPCYIQMPKIVYMNPAAIIQENVF